MNEMALPEPTWAVDDHTAPLSVGSISDEAAGVWDAFIASQPTGTFYHLHGWKGINEAELGHACEYLAAMRPDGTIVGVLPLVLVASRLFGRILCSMPFVNYGGPLAASAAVRTLLAEHATRRANALRADYLELRCASALDTGMPVSLRKVSMTIPLERDPDKLFAAFTTKHRNQIRRAFKNDLTVEHGGIELLPAFYEVLERSWHELGTPLYRQRYFERVLQTFPTTTRIFVCRASGRPAAVAFNGYSHGTVEGMWAGVDPEFRHLQPNYALYWEMLRHSCEAGFDRFHLGRSTANSGAEAFKEKWLATPSQLYWYFHRPKGGEMPGLNVDNPKYRLAIAAWRRMPIWATRAIGPHVARLIP